MKIDNGTITRTVSHVFKSDYSGNLGRDMCLEMFGTQDQECIDYNTGLSNEKV